ncbi:LysM peptidoglycan-binding domain-containing protein [Sellimonas sp.]|uniref:LysM peptidoglycan-binding domain-containing protein n=1 Tax=Sellimonas sp. TaxID=2021466 RepID=UPI0025800D86|nr:LysM peptidoglycan-binding domain-containing protein [Sellimonas sp.]
MKNSSRNQISMTRAERGTKKKISKKRQAAFRFRLLIGAVILFASISVLSAGTLLSNAKGNRAEDPVYFEYYKNIEVKDGDTLHGLAKEYNTSIEQSDDAYVKKLKKLNHMKSSGLIPGQSLIIMYYDTEYK